MRVSPIIRHRYYHRRRATAGVGPDVSEALHLIKVYELHASLSNQFLKTATLSIL